MSKNKVFCIGFQKTGTSSMAKALKQLGYSVTGPNGVNDPEIPKKVHRETAKLMKRFDAFQDNPWPQMYQWCHEKYPAAKFILTIRDTEKWYNSALKQFGDSSTHMREWIYGKGKGSPINNRDCWIERYTRHNAEVVEYFKGKENFLILDITQSGAWEKLCPFLGMPVPSEPFPHANPARERNGKEKKVFFLKRWKRAVFGRTRVW